MGLVHLLVSGGVVAGFLFAASCVASLAITGLFSVAFQNIDRTRLAFGSAGLFPVMACTLVLIVTLDAFRDGFPHADKVSILIGGLGSALSLVIAWPSAFYLTKRVYGLDR